MEESLGGRCKEGGIAPNAAAGSQHITPTETQQQQHNNNATTQQRRQQKRAKPDMIAFAATKDRLAPPAFGEVPGVRLGSEWNGRGEVAIVGLHRQMMRVRLIASERAGAARAAERSFFSPKHRAGINP